jgi:hypothetical protein
MEEVVVLENDRAEDHRTDDPVCSSKHNSEDEDEEESGKTGLHRLSVFCNVMDLG